MINLSDRERELIDQICQKNAKSGKKGKKVEEPGKLVSNSSTKILVQRLERKLNETLNEVDEQKIGQITFQQLGRIFTLLDIFQAISYNQEYQLEAQGLNNPLQKQQEADLHEKAFAILSNGEEHVDIQAVFCFFRIILDPNYLEPSKCGILIKEYLEKILEKEFDQDTIAQFCNEFQAYQKTRLSGAKIGYLKATLAQNLIESYEKTLTFKPTINPISEALQQQSAKKENMDNSQSHSHSHSQFSAGLAESRVSELYRKKEIANQKIEQLKQEKITKEMQECTFKPQIWSKKELPNVIDRLYQVKNRAEVEEKTRQAELEKEQSEFSKCSFHPQINFQMPDTPFAEIKGFERNIQRVRTAIDQRHLRDLRLNHKPAGEKYEKVKSMPFIPPDMLSRSRNKKELPILYIDIKLGPSKVGRLALRKNDDVEEVVKSFCKVWGVGQQDYDMLVNQVKENLQNVIEETDESEI